jgi:DnaJ-class molecular chaperone
MSNVFRCPVCYGKGRVPVSFYVLNIQETSGTTDVFGQPCKSCGGTGLVWASKEQQEDTIHHKSYGTFHQFGNDIDMESDTIEDK